MKGPATFAVIASVLLLGSASAHALDSGFYAGLNIGQADHDLEANFKAAPGGELTYTADIDSKDTAYGVFGGYQFGRWFAVEGAFNHFGKSEIDYFYRYQDSLNIIESRGSVEGKANAFSVAGLLTIPLGDTFSFGVRAGVAYSNFEHDSATEFRFNGEVSPVDH